MHLPSSHSSAPASKHLFYPQCGLLLSCPKVSDSVLPDQSLSDRMDSCRACLFFRILQLCNFSCSRQSTECVIVHVLALSHLPAWLTDWTCVFRAFASWKEFVTLSCEKRGKLEKASKACFASTLQRAWAVWRAHLHRHKLLRKALESRQVNMSC